jgi:hypothetical protein
MILGGFKVPGLVSRSLNLELEKFALAFCAGSVLMISPH